VLSRHGDVVRTTVVGDLISLHWPCIAPPTTDPLSPRRPLAVVRSFSFGSAPRALPRQSATAVPGSQRRLLHHHGKPQVSSRFCRHVPLRGPSSCAAALGQPGRAAASQLRRSRLCPGLFRSAAQDPWPFSRGARRGCPRPPQVLSHRPWLAGTGCLIACSVWDSAPDFQRRAGPGNQLQRFYVGEQCLHCSW
jgi:hypothetical protein